METQRGLLKKLGIFSAVAIGLAYGGKKHIAHQRNERHINESDATIGNSKENFDAFVEEPGRESYAGKGTSYATRQPGDRLTLMSFFFGRKD